MCDYKRFNNMKILKDELKNQAFIIIFSATQMDAAVHPLRQAHPVLEPPTTISQTREGGD